MNDHEKSDETGEQNEIDENEAVDENLAGGNGTGQKVAKAAGMVAGVTTGAATVASVSAGGAFAVPGMGMGLPPVLQVSPPGRLWRRVRS